MGSKSLQGKMSCSIRVISLWHIMARQYAECPNRPRGLFSKDSYSQITCKHDFFFFFSFLWCFLCEWPTNDQSISARRNVFPQNLIISIHLKHSLQYVKAWGQSGTCKDGNVEIKLEGHHSTSWSTIPVSSAWTGHMHGLWKTKLVCSLPLYKPENWD